MSKIYIYRGAALKILIVWGTWILSGPLSSQNYDGSVVPDNASKLPYKSFGTRSEGFYTSSISELPSLDVIGATIGKFDFVPDKTKVLSISSPLWTQPLDVRASGIALRTFYRMDMQVPGGSSVSWNVADVLLARGLTSSDIGVTGYTGANESKLYIPVLVTPSPNNIPNDGKVHLILRATVDVTDVRFRWAPANGGKSGNLSNWTPCTPSSFNRGTPIEIVLPPFNGTIYIEIAAVNRNNQQWLKNNLNILDK